MLERRTSFALGAVTLAALLSVVSSCGGGSGGDETGSEIAPRTSNGFFAVSEVVRDGQGNILRELELTLDPTENVVDGTVSNGGEITRLRTVYADSGDRIRTEGLDDRLRVLRRIDYIHDSEGYLATIRSERFDEGFGSPITEESFEYDDGRRLTGRTLRNPEGTVLLTYDYAFDSRGLISTRTEIFFSDGMADIGQAPEMAGEILERSVRTYRYDDRDRIVATDTDIDSDGSVDQRRSLQYDAFGNVVVETIMDDSGAVASTTTRVYEQVDETVYNQGLFSATYFP